MRLLNEKKNKSNPDITTGKIKIKIKINPPANITAGKIKISY